MRARARSQVYPRSADDIELPIDCPGTAPAPTPAVSHTVTATVGLTGLSCSEYTETEEAILVTALAMTLSGVEEGDIGDTTCADARRRRRRHVRRLLGNTDSVSISFPVTVSATSASVAASSIDSSLTSAVDSGSLEDNLATAAEAADGDSVIGSASVDSASATVSDDDADDGAVTVAADDDDDTSAAMVTWVIIGGVVVALVLAIGLIAFKLGTKVGETKRPTTPTTMIQVASAQQQGGVQLQPQNVQVAHNVNFSGKNGAVTI